MKKNGILFSWAKTHTNEVLKVGIKKNQINNHEPYCALKAMKQQFGLQASNKENVSPILKSKTKRSTL